MEERRQAIAVTSRAAEFVFVFGGSEVAFQCVADAASLALEGRFGGET